MNYLQTCRLHEQGHFLDKHESHNVVFFELLNDLLVAINGDVIMYSNCLPDRVKVWIDLSHDSIFSIPVLMTSFLRFLGKHSRAKPSVKNKHAIWIQMLLCGTQTCK